MIIDPRKTKVRMTIHTGYTDDKSSDFTIEKSIFDFIVLNDILEPMLERDSNSNPVQKITKFELIKE